MARLANAQTGNSKGSRKTKFSEVLSLARDELEPVAEEVQADMQLGEYANMQIADNADMRLDEYSHSQIDGKVDMRIGEATGSQVVLPPEPTPKGRKTGKRSNPDYVGAYFSIPKELHRQLDRYVIDLADDGVEMDRSQVIARLIEGVTGRSKEVGANQALMEIGGVQRTAKIV